MYLKKCLNLYKKLIYTVLFIAFVLASCVCKFYYGGLPFNRFKKEITAAEGSISVMVTGAVKNPGVYTLSRLSRVSDALALAGALDTADPARINLAMYLEDGQKVNVPFNSSGSDNGTEKRININTAGKDELVALPGIGPALAEKIILYRERHGNFEQIADIINVSGIGSKIFEDIKDLITI